MSDAPVLKRIREMILSGQLPPGARVTEAGLAELLGVSRTPVRNVLPTLATDGLLVPAGRRGYAVRAFSEKESWEALELRAFLEGHAARLLANKGASPEVLGVLDECLREGDALFEKRYLEIEDEQRYGVMNGRFHRTIVEAADAPFVAGMVERLNLAPFVAPSVIVFDEIGLKKAFDLLFCAHGCHHAIVDAIRDGDGHRAETLFREHAQQQRLSMFARRHKQQILQQAGRL